MNIIKYSFCLLLSLLFVPQFLSAQSAPVGVGGFSLGSQIDSYSCPMSPNYLKEKIVDMENGFRKGTLYYGTYKYPDQILKMKLKYMDKSRRFFNQLEQRLTKRYGKPDTWAGDAFQLQTIWKWHFTDSTGQAVSMTIEYNSKDIELSIGTVIKLSYPMKIEEERISSMKRNALPPSSTPGQKKDVDWQALLPQ